MLFNVFFILPTFFILKKRSLKIPCEITFETTETNWVCMTVHHHHQRTDLGGIMTITSVFTIGPFVPCTPLCKILNTPVMSILDLQVRVRVSEKSSECEWVGFFFSLSLSEKNFENTQYRYLHCVTFLASLYKELPAAMSLMIMSTMNRLCSWRLLCTWDQLQWRRR